MNYRVEVMVGRETGEVHGVLLRIRSETAVSSMLDLLNGRCFLFYNSESELMTASFFHPITFAELNELPLESGEREWIKNVLPMCMLTGDEEVNDAK